ncbi:lysophospholipid acyltransferase family protein [Egicoccus sp. AB-alg2]|uniref:lysophospholipid acyltransferase family protein n=1 Tax=Egicoccus sp. AB-alg2 TaxID=3242693 RepID=UPI00359D299F
MRLREAARDWRWGRRPLPPGTVVDTVQAPGPRPFPTGWSRTRPARVARTGLQAGVLAPLLASQLDITVEDRERVLEAARAPVVLAPNHSSHLDAPLVLTALPPEVRRKTVTVAASDYFFDAWWRAAATALVFNAVPIDRTQRSRSELPDDLLAAGNHLLLFPEGTRSKDGWAGRFRHGAAHLAKTAGVAIVPVAIEGSWRAMPRGAAWPVSGRPRVRVRFGAPLRARADEPVTALTGRLEDSIAVLLDEHRTDWWTAMRNRQKGETPSARGPQVADWRRRWELLEPDDRDARRRVWPARGGGA